MTEAGQIIAALEVAPAEDIDGLLRTAASDPVAAPLLRFLCDPFRQWWRDSVQDLDSFDPVKASAALAREWSFFADWLEAMSLREVSDDDLVEWRTSEAWPLYLRVLSKRLRCDTVSRNAVSTAIGAVPQFYLGEVVDPSDTPIQFPCAVEPYVPGTRCVTLLSRPRSADRQAWFLGQLGLPFPVPVPEAIRQSLVRPTYKKLGPEFTDGAVIDGVVNMAGYTVFDIVPLVQFREQQRTDPYDIRVMTLASVAFGDGVHCVPAQVVHDEEGLLRSTRVVQRRGFGQAVIKQTLAPYPYFAEQYQTQAWTRPRCICNDAGDTSTHLPNCLRFVPTF